MVNRTFQSGDVVTLSAAWSEGDSSFYVVAEWNGDRGFIKPLDWQHGDIVPTELVTAEMIELAAR